MSRLRNAATSAAGAGLAVLALAVPALAYLRASAPDLVADRHDAPDSSLTEGQRRAFAAGASPTTAPLILSYHDVRPDPPAGDRYTVTPQQLSDQLAMLDAAGYTSITSDDLVAWLDGRRDLPGRSVLLTFDDGTSGLWRYADDVLEDHGFHAVAFVITGRVGTHRPYYLTWEELDRLEASGRWDVESHTHLGHDRVPAAGDGTRLPFLINRRWLDREDRLETLDEFTHRVHRDLAASVRDLGARGLGPSQLFAYPFSAETNPTNDPDAPRITAATVADLFEASMTNVVPDRLVTERDRRRRALPRIEVFRTTSAEELFDRIRLASPTPPGPAAPLQQPGDWTDTAGEPLGDGVRFDSVAGTVTLDAGDGYVGAEHAPGRSPDWAGYEVTATAAGLGGSDGGPTGSLFALVGSAQMVQVAVSASYVQVEVGGGGPTAAPARVVAQHRLPVRDHRSITIEVRPGEVVVVIDGRALTRIATEPDTTGGVGLAASGGSVTFSAMQLASAGAPP